ncbi:MAG: PIG-L deacetylase family protein [Gammaproteobacteria bacterium]
MLPLALSRHHGRLKTALCLGSHCDDIEIGCGGTILRLVQEHPKIKLHWVVFSSDRTRAAEAQKSAEYFLERVGNKIITIKEFKNSFFPFCGAEIKEYFEKLKTRISPDIVFTHYRGDLHQDHRLISDLTWNTFRDHLILEYEIVKYDGDFSSPNFFVPLSDDERKRKVRYILECFETQKGKHWFTEETFYSVMRLRGIECNSSSGYAEAFYCRKMVL